MNHRSASPGTQCRSVLSWKYWPLSQECRWRDQGAVTHLPCPLLPSPYGAEDTKLECTYLQIKKQLLPRCYQRQEQRSHKLGFSPVPPTYLIVEVALFLWNCNTLFCTLVFFSLHGLLYMCLCERNCRCWFQLKMLEGVWVVGQWVGVMRGEDACVKYQVWVVEVSHVCGVLLRVDQESTAEPLLSTC